MSVAPTLFRANLSAAAADSANPPMQVSAITHSTASPLGWRRDDSSLAAERAMSMVRGSSDSRTPLRLPSIAGRMPILGRPPQSRFPEDTIISCSSLESIVNVQTWKSDPRHPHSKRATDLSTPPLWQAGCLGICFNSVALLLLQTTTPFFRMIFAYRAFSPVATTA